MSRAETEGQRRLAAWFEEDPSRSRAALGRRLGVTGQAVSQWLRGVQPPDESLWELLEAATGIAGLAFLTESEKQKRADRLARLDALRNDVAAVTNETPDRPSATGTDGH